MTTVATEIAKLNFGPTRLVAVELGDIVRVKPDADSAGYAQYSVDGGKSFHAWAPGTVEVETSHTVPFEKALVRFVATAGRVVGEVDDEVAITPGGGVAAPSWVMSHGAAAGLALPNGQTLLMVNVKAFGAKGDGETNDTDAIVAALASLSAGGTLYLPPGTYIFHRGTGSVLADTIPASNVTIIGAGAASIIKGFNGNGTLPNSTGNEYYNVFQATGRSNITIRDISFRGCTTPVSMFSCSGVLVENIFDDALLENAGGHLRNKSVYLFKCNDVRVINSRFLNTCFGVYVSGDGATKTKNCVVAHNHFEHTVAAGAYTAPFPVGVYGYYSDGLKVLANTFKNVYSSVDNGDSGTGMGYAVYEGDGASDKLTVVDNTIHFDAKGDKNAMGMYISEAKHTLIANNNIQATDGARMVAGIRVDSKVSETERLVQGNLIRIGTSPITPYAIFATATNTTNVGRYAIVNNIVQGGVNGIRVEAPQASHFDVSGNLLSDQTAAGIRIGGVVGPPIKFPRVTNNRIQRAGTNGILIVGYVVSATIVGNILLDGNLSEAAGDLGAAILFSSYSYGSVILNNVIGNTAYGGGKFTFGVQNVENPGNRIFKDIIANNNFLGLFPFGQRYFTSAPTNGIFDIEHGDFIANVHPAAGGPAGWYCVDRRLTTVSRDASSASTTINVSSTSGMAAGDVVLLCKSSNPYGTGYYTSADWHVDTIASVTNGTSFVLTTGIPVGDGTYAVGAFVKSARFKAGATIAA